MQRRADCAHTQSRGRRAPQRGSTWALCRTALALLPSFPLGRELHENRLPVVNSKEARGSARGTTRSARQRTDETGVAAFATNLKKHGGPYTSGERGRNGWAAGVVGYFDCGKSNRASTSSMVSTWRGSIPQSGEDDRLGRAVAHKSANVPPFAMAASTSNRKESEIDSERRSPRRSGFGHILIGFEVFPETT
jgi:hypothetical protein